MIDAEFAKVRPGALDPDAGRTVADDPGAPRRALLAERCLSPGTYAPLFAYDPAGSDPDLTWQEAISDVFDEAAGISDPNEVSSEERVAIYAAMPDDLRVEWNRHWRADAHAWIDAVPDPYGQSIGDGGPDGWRDAITFPTTDGGLLVVCPYDDKDLFGAAAWCEAIRFGYGEVAGAVGVTTPTRWDVD